MVFGHNTNVKMGAVTFHVQTEDRGEYHGLIDTTVYHQGRVLHRRTNNYFDLVPLDEDREQALKLRLDEQHRAVLEEIRSNKLQLAIPQTNPATVAPKLIVPAAEAVVAENSAPNSVGAATPRRLGLELVNAKGWLAGKHATLQIAVREENGDPVHGAQVIVGVDGSAEPFARSGETGLYGQVKVEFDMPRITGGEAAIIINAKEGLGAGHLRFTLRAKPRVPAG
jgi:hypothetical protein